MLEIREREAHANGTTSASDASVIKLRLPFEARQRSRSRVSLSSGEEVALLLPRGTVMRGGDVLLLSDGRRVVVEAASETVSTVLTDEAERLARAAYHLGNRHVALEIGRGFVRYLHDHVLDDLVRGLGLPVRVEEAPFEPEAGAYAHGHDHEHPHEHRGHEHAHHDHEERT